MFIHTPRLWLRKVDNIFVITKYDKIETLHKLIYKSLKSLHIKVQQIIPYYF